jgi:hypothetical protein
VWCACMDRYAGVSSCTVYEGTGGAGGCNEGRLMAKREGLCQCHGCASESIYRNCDETSRTGASKIYCRLERH